MPASIGRSQACRARYRGCLVRRAVNLVKQLCLLSMWPLQNVGPRNAALKARRDSSAATGEQGTSKADPKAVSAHGVAAAMAADTSRPLDMLIIANRLSEGASAL